MHGAVGPLLALGLDESYILPQVFLAQAPAACANSEKSGHGLAGLSGRVGVVGWGSDMATAPRNGGCRVHGRPIGAGRPLPEWQRVQRMADRSQRIGGSD